MLTELLENKPLWAAILSWVIAQVLKVVILLVTEKKVDFTRLYGSGGMPSSHTALVCALAASLGKLYGLNSPLFAISAVFSSVVMYDAAGVRRAAGKQAQVINWLLHLNGYTYMEQLKELLGHTPLQVFAGATLGVAVGVIF